MRRFEGRRFQRRIDPAGLARSPAGRARSRFASIHRCRSRATPRQAAPLQGRPSGRFAPSVPGSSGTLDVKPEPYAEPAPSVRPDSDGRKPAGARPAPEPSGYDDPIGERGTATTQKRSIQGPDGASEPWSGLEVQRCGELTPSNAGRRGGGGGGGARGARRGRGGPGGFGARNSGFGCEPCVAVVFDRGDRRVHRHGKKAGQPVPDYSNFAPELNSSAPPARRMVMPACLLFQ